jgi:hypothetical protein
MKDLGCSSVVSATTCLKASAQFDEEAEEEAVLWFG